MPNGVSTSSRFYTEVVGLREHVRSKVQVILTCEVEAAGAWLDSHGVRRKPVSDGFTAGSRYVTFFDPDGIPLEFYYMDAAYADVYGLDVEPQ